MIPRLHDVFGRGIGAAPGMSIVHVVPAKTLTCVCVWQVLATFGMLRFDRSCQSSRHDNCGEFQDVLDAVIVAGWRAKSRRWRRHRTGDKQPIVETLLLIRMNVLASWFGLYRSFQTPLCSRDMKVNWRPLASVGPRGQGLEIPGEFFSWNSNGHMSKPPPFQRFEGHDGEELRKAPAT